KHDTPAKRPVDRIADSQGGPVPNNEVAAKAARFQVPEERARRRLIREYPELARLGQRGARSLVLVSGLEHAPDALGQPRGRDRRSDPGNAPGLLVAASQQGA